MRTNESKLQRACVKWFRYEHSRYNNLLFAVPNGGNRNPATGAILKAEGVLAGVSDMILLLPLNGSHALCIEFKIGKGKQSASQEDFQNAVEKYYYKYVVIRSFDEFQREINFYINGKNNV